MALASSEMDGLVCTEMCKVSELSVEQVLFLKNKHFFSLLIKNKYEVRKQNQSEEAFGMGEISVKIFFMSHNHRITEW